MSGQFGKRGVSDPQPAAIPLRQQHVSSRQQLWRLAAGLGVAAALVWAGLLILISNGPTKTAEEIESDRSTALAQSEYRKKVAEEERCAGQDLSAFVMSQNPVQRMLKAPSTASFPYITDPDVSVRATQDCQYSVRSWVEGKNPFGVPLRMPYSATMRYYPDDGSWSLVDVDLKTE